MSCCGNHKHSNQINSQKDKIDSRGGNQENNQGQANKKGSWLMWVVAILLIILLIFSFIR